MERIVKKIVFIRVKTSNFVPASAKVLIKKEK